MAVSIQHVERVLAYLNENGESETLKHFNIKSESLSRYTRRKKFWDTKQPKVLLLDCETTPIKAFAWGTYKQRIPHTSIIQPSFLICWSAKWLFDSKIMCDVLTPEESIHKDDTRIVKSVWKLIDQCDVIIAHNGKRFDIPYLKTRFVLNRLAPTSPYQVIDTYEVARKNFLFPSNKLDYLGVLMRNKGKIKTDFDLWVRCLDGDREALSYMVDYNKEDVTLLEEAYLFVRPFIHNHPNMAIYQEAHEPSCPTCGSTNIQECGHYTTSVNRYLAFRCNDCGAICRSRATDVPIKCKSGIMRPTAR